MEPASNPPLHAAHGGASFDEVGVDFAHLERRDAVVSADVLDAWYDPAPSVLAALRDHLAWLVRTSPPVHAEGLVRTISEVRGIPEDRLLVGSGSSSLIYLALPQLVRAGDRVLVLDPTYGEYQHLLRTVMYMRPVRLELRREDAFQPRMDELLRQAELADVVLLVNPNSPTGTFLDADAMRAVLAAMPRMSWLVVDETYVDFVPGDASLETWIGAHPNVVIIKSMSKQHALSGLRVGYLAANEDLVRKLQPLNPPWPVSLMGQVAAVAALHDPAYYRARTEETRVLRDGLSDALAAVPGLLPYPSAANFLLVELLGRGVTAAEVARKTRELSVHVRACDDLGESMKGRYVRIAVKDVAQNARIVEAMRHALPAVFEPREDLVVPPASSGAPLAESSGVQPIPPAALPQDDSSAVAMAPAEVESEAGAEAAHSPSTAVPAGPEAARPEPHGGNA